MIYVILLEKIPLDGKATKAKIMQILCDLGKKMLILS